MFLMELVVALVLALVFTFLLITLFGWRRRDGTRAGSIFRFLFFLLLLMVWAGGGWIRPFGPTIFGVAWLPFLIVGVVMMLIILALVPPDHPMRKTLVLREKDQEESADSLITAFFWLLVILLIGALIAHYSR